MSNIKDESEILENQSSFRNSNSFRGMRTLVKQEGDHKAHLFNNKLMHSIDYIKSEELLILPKLLNDTSTNLEMKIKLILAKLRRTYHLNLINKNNLFGRYEELSKKQNKIEQTLEKIKRINKSKQKKHVKYLRYVPLNKIYFYSPKKHHFYYILMDIVIKSRKKSQPALVKDNDANNIEKSNATLQSNYTNTKHSKKSLLSGKKIQNVFRFREEEDKILKELMLYSGEYTDWYQLSRDFNDFVRNILLIKNSEFENFKSRTPVECYTRSLEISDFFNYKKWTKNEDLILKKAILYYGPKNWQQISYCLDGRNNSQAFHRWMKGINPKIRRSKWSFEEDLTLGVALRIYGNKKWSKIANHLEGRTDIQCRERFCNILDPSLEEVEWKPYEDAKLLLLYDKMNNKWSKIAKEFGNRTDNTCWRRWKYLDSIRKNIANTAVLRINNINSHNIHNNSLSHISVSNTQSISDTISEVVCDNNNTQNKKIANKIISKKKKKKEIFIVRKLKVDTIEEDPCK